MNDPKIEDEPSKRFRIYRTDKGGQSTYGEVIAEYDTEVEVLAHRWRRDWHHAILEHRKPVTLEDLRRRVWKCGLCDQSVIRRPDRALPILPVGYFKNCKLRDHMISDECIARRDLETACKLVKE